MKIFNNDNLFICFLIFLIVVLFGIRKSNLRKIKEQANLLESLNSDLITWKDKDSLNKAKIEVIKTQKTKDFLNLKTKDSIIIELQNEVKENKKKLKQSGSSVTIFETKSDIKHKSETQVVARDTIKNYIFPEYKSNINLDEWVVGNVIANRDSTMLDIKIKNSYSIVIGSEKQGLFKKTKPYVEVTNKNPFSETESLRTYQVSLPRQKRFSLGISVNYGIGKGFEFQPFVGIGIQYNLIRF